ncbi:MAG: hypothetical protein OXU20_02520, partial [Myxococcales bacterium]|nr:hypothetical protein [Myxococcales bacterium]
RLHIQFERSVSRHLLTRGDGDVRLPPQASAFHTDELLLRADDAIRQGPLREFVAANPNATVFSPRKAPVGFDAGRGFSRIGGVRHRPGTQGPLRRHDGLDHVSGHYRLNPQTGEWDTITLFPDLAPQ